MAHYLGDTWNVTQALPKEIQEEPPVDAETIAIIVILCMFSVIGTLGNGLVLYVFTRKTIKVTSTIFILALAGTDFLTCLIVIPFTVVAIHINYQMTYDIVCKVYQFLITCNVPLSAFIMVAIAVDRYICICHPFVHIMTVRRAKIVVVILTCFAFVLGLLTALGFSVYEVQLPESTNTTANPWTDIPSNVTEKITGFVPLFTDNSSSVDGSAYQHPKYAQSDTGLDGTTPSPSDSTMVVFNGQCTISPVLLPYEFIAVYQKIYSAFYLFSLLIVLILYGIIYSSVTKQRAKRRAQKMGKKVKQVNTQCQTDESTMPLNTLGTSDDNHANQNCKLKVEIDGETVSTRLSVSQVNGNANSETHPLNRSSSKKHSPAQADHAKEKKDHNRLANIKTAVMLFIVTLVFIIAFLPAWLMAHRWLTFQTIVFYMYFSYNVANPIIYAFMNPTFREEMCKIFSSFRGYCNIR